MENPGDIVDSRGYFGLKLSPTSEMVPLMTFLKNLSYQNNFKETMNKGRCEIRCALFNFFQAKKCPFSVTSGCCPQFLK